MFVIVFFLAGGLLAVTVCALAWQLVGRPVAVALGWIPMTPDDYVLCALEAERDRRWVDALRAYDNALELNDSHQEARNRQHALFELLATNPELTEGTELG
ncbi:MAG: hypothetical protein L0241_17140 [Planctomycetia bacterium]|nr:hypothetical protein [Planctomycetia bacterium]